jgi:hypothetical protein
MPAAEQTKRTGSGGTDTPGRIVFSGSEEAGHTWTGLEGFGATALEEAGLTEEAEEFTEEVEGCTGDTT